MSPRRPNSANQGRRREVLATAARIFADKGYDATSLQDIGDALGLLKGSVYHYISSKENVLYEIANGVHTRLDENVRFTEAFDGSPLEKIYYFCYRHVSTAFIPDTFVNYSVWYLNYRSLSAERQKVILERRDRYDRFLRNLLRSGQEAGQVCPDIDPRVAAFTLLGLLNSPANWYKPHGGIKPDEVARQLADIAVASVSCSPTKHKPMHRTVLDQPVLDQIRSDVKTLKDPFDESA